MRTTGRRNASAVRTVGDTAVASQGGCKFRARVVSSGSGGLGWITVQARAS